MKDSRDVVIAEPEDEAWEYDHYIKKFGAPESNGAGHKVMMLPNMNGQLVRSVTIPGASIRKIKRGRS